MFNKNLNIIFLGTDFKKGKGGIASVLTEYEKIFPAAKFVSTTTSKGSFSNLISFCRALLILPYYLIKKPNSVVHIHGASFNSFYRKFIFIKVSLLFGAKVVYHIHGGQFRSFYENANRRTKNFISDAVDSVDCIICLSESWRNYFASNFRPKKIEVIANIVPNCNRISRSGALNTFPLNFIFLGDISKPKGVWWLIKTCAENKVGWEGKIKIKLAGKGDTLSFLHDIEKNELEGIMEYIGWISGDEKEQILKASDIFILPSFNEGLPISILEAMSHSLPIISTNVGGIPEIVEQHKNGILVEPGNSAQLTEAIDFAINNSQKFLSYGAQNLERVKPHFPENVKKELILLYQSL